MNDVGDVVAGRYRLLRRLGSGAMGTVWQATDELLQRQVAVKQLLNQPGLPPEHAEQARQRAMREGRIAARLHHRNAVAVHDVAVHDGLPVLIMEYVPGRSLADVLAQQATVTPAMAANIGAQAAAALAAAHAADIVHRDVKPGNVLLADDGTVKITDFGIARAAGDASLTGTGLFAGTPTYLAPEVARGQDPTPNSDMFSLGATLFEAVEGAPPFGSNHDNPIALLHVIAAGRVPPPRHAGPLTAALHQLLHADPAERPSAEHAQRTLRAVATAPGQQEPVSRTARQDTQPFAATPATQAVGTGAGGTRIAPHPPGPAEQHAAGRNTRTRTALYLALAAVVALAAGTVALAWSSSTDGNQPGTDQRPNATLTNAEARRSVSAYYALLPEDTDRAWNRLGARLRTEGKARYQRHWNKVSDVEIISAPRTTGQRTVHVGIELTMRAGGRTTEFHQLRVSARNNSPVISADTVLHSEHTPAPRQPQPEDDGKDRTKDKDENKKDEDKEDEKQDRKGEEDKKGERDKKGHDN